MVDLFEISKPFRLITLLHLISLEEESQESTRML